LFNYKWLTIDRVVELRVDHQIEVVVEAAIAQAQEDPHHVREQIRVTEKEIEID